MFKTVGNTIELMGASWRVLQHNKHLLWLPVMSGAAMVVLIVVLAATLAAGGSFTRIENEGLSVAEYILFAVFYLAMTFAVIYFNSALVAAAYDYMKGGKPTISSALDAANEHLPSIFGWACFSTTIGLVLDQLRHGDNGVLKIVGWIIGAIWAYMTYFVVPILVIEGLGPFEAIQRSTNLFRETWGKQLVSNFGFGIAYFVVIVVGIAPLILASTSSAAAAVVVGLLVTAPIIIGGVIVLVAMEAIFKAALYQYAATGEAPDMFSPHVLRNAYVEKGKRGGWGDGWGSGSGSYSAYDTRGSNNYGDQGTGGWGAPPR